MNPDNKNFQILLKDMSLDGIRMDDKLRWEHQLTNELEGVPVDMRSDTREYLNTIIQAAREGEIDPAQYAEKIIIENSRFAPVWRFLSETISQVHDEMIETFQTNQATAKRLQQSFLKMIQQAGILHEGTMGDAMRHILSKLQRYPGQPPSP